jgi:hypothetical protein
MESGVTLLLEENDLWDIVKDVVPLPTSAIHSSWQLTKEGSEAKWMIMDAIKDHLIPHISKKKTTKEMFDALVSLYQSENINKKMILQNKLKSIEMTKSNTITNYLMKVVQICDQLLTVGEKVVDAELVNMELNGFLDS